MKAPDRSSPCSQVLADPSSISWVRNETESRASSSAGVGRRVASIRAPTNDERGTEAEGAPPVLSCIQLRKGSEVMTGEAPGSSHESSTLRAGAPGRWLMIVREAGGGGSLAPSLPATMREEQWRSRVRKNIPIPKRVVPFPRPAAVSATPSGRTGWDGLARRAKCNKSCHGRTERDTVGATDRVTIIARMCMPRMVQHAYSAGDRAARLRTRLGCIESPPARELVLR